MARIGTTAECTEPALTLRDVVPDDAPKDALPLYTASTVSVPIRSCEPLKGMVAVAAPVVSLGMRIALTDNISLFGPGIRKSTWPVGTADPEFGVTVALRVTVSAGEKDNGAALSNVVVVWGVEDSQA